MSDRYQGAYYTRQEACQCSGGRHSPDGMCPGCPNRKLLTATATRDIPDAGPVADRIGELEAALRAVRADLKAVAEMTTRTAAMVVTEGRR